MWQWGPEAPASALRTCTLERQEGQEVSKWEGWEQWCATRRQPFGVQCILFHICNSFAQRRSSVLTLLCPVIILLLSSYFKNSLNQVLMTPLRRESQCLVGKQLPSHPKNWGRWGSVDGLLMVRTGTPGIFICDFPCASESVP